jgi:ABC-type antimicrobial peptide transport system permease subunit
MAQTRVAATLLALFALIALFLCAVGTYAVVSYSVARRSREIGVRMALGAQRKDIVLMVIRNGGSLVIAGSVFGLVSSFAAGRVLQSIVVSIGPSDPLALVGSVVVLNVIALLAIYVPAQRAASEDPANALRA